MRRNILAPCGREAEVVVRLHERFVAMVGRVDARRPFGADDSHRLVERLDAVGTALGELQEAARILKERTQAAEDRWEKQEAMRCEDVYND